MKSLLNRPWVIRLLAGVMALYGRFVFATCRVRYVTPLPAQLKGGPVILALWHQQLFAVPLLARPNPRPLYGLMSASRDGSFTRAVAAHFGIGAGVGSSHRGAITGSRTLLRAVQAGGSLFLTPDGPRGPRHQCKPGATEIAERTGLPLIPCAAWPVHGHNFGSWDATRLPYPFTTYVVAYGAAMQHLSPQHLTQSLNALTVQAQAAAGVLDNPSPAS